MYTKGLEPSCARTKIFRTQQLNMDEPNNMFELEYGLKNILLIMHSAGLNGTK